MVIVESIQKQLYATVYTDIRRLQTLHHNILLGKLDYYGIRGVAKNWFESYLNNQKQFFTLNESNSSFKPV